MLGWWALSNLSPERWARMSRVFEGYLTRGEIPGIVGGVSRRGEAAVEIAGTMGFDDHRPTRRDTIFRIASITKPIVAVAAMILVEECRLRLDDPVDHWLPELADRRVLARIDGPLEETVPAKRPITLRDLLTLRMGIGYTMDALGRYPIHGLLSELGILQGPPHPARMPDTDEWMRRVGQLPLMWQPGEVWAYDLGLDVAGVLVARASGMPLGEFMRERIFEPLGMRDTGFYVPEEKLDRLAMSYAPDWETGEIQLYDGAVGGEWSRPPRFESGSGGLVSTVDDLLAFGQMMLRGGQGENGRILSRLSVEAMTTEQVTPEQRRGAEMFFGDNRGWGLGMAVFNRRDDVFAVPGRFGWDGGLGTAWYVDPKEGMVGVLLTQMAWTSPEPPRIWQDFWTTAYQAIGD